MALFIEVLIPKTDPSTILSTEILAQFMGLVEDRQPKSVLCFSGSVMFNRLQLFQTSCADHTNLSNLCLIGTSLPYPSLRCLVFLPMTHAAHTHARGETGLLETRQQRSRLQAMLSFCQSSFWLAFALSDKYSIISNITYFQSLFHLSA